MANRPPREESQFSGATAKFRKKEMETTTSTKPCRSTVGSNGKLMGRSNSTAVETKIKNVFNSTPFMSPQKNLKKSASASPSPSLSPFAKNTTSKHSKCHSMNSRKYSILSSPHKGYKFNSHNAEPDVKIQVKTDIQRSINARKQKHYGSQQNSRRPSPFSSSQNESDVPEHIRKARERETRRLRALEEKEFRSASLLQAVLLGWYVRTFIYPALRTEYITRRKRILAILTVQKVFRMHIQRKQYRHIIAWKRRRERNMKDIKKIQKKIDKMPKKTKQDIKEKKKEYESRKKEMLNKTRKQIKEDDEKINRAKEAGKDMIKYLNDENDKVKNLLNTIQREHAVLEKQFEVLTVKSEEIASNFKSLQQWVDSKNKSIKRNEASDQKCRYRYLPKYREDLVLRNKYCITEFRVKELYKRQLGKISKSVEARSTDSSLLRYVEKEMRACKKLLREMPDNPLPEGLEHRLKYKISLLP